MELELFSKEAENLPMFKGMTKQDDTEPVLTQKNDTEENKVSPWAYIPAIVAVVICAGVCPVVALKYKKKKEEENG